MRVPLVMALVVLAGCSQVDSASDAQPGGGEGEEADPLAAPGPWNVGQWWTYRLSTVQDPITWIVTEDAGDAWTVDVDHAEFRFVHDALGQISTVGSIGKSDLQGAQEHGEIRFLDFPLEMNKTWDLTWDATSWQAKVVDVDGGTAEVRAEDGAGAVRVYVYDAEVGWFRSMQALDANGTMLFEAELQKGGSGYAGDYVRWTVHDPYILDVRPGAPVLQMFEVPDDSTDIWYSYQVLCNPGGLEGDQGTGTLDVQPESGQGGVSRQDICPAADTQQGTLEAQAGQWGVTGTSTGAAYVGALIPRSLQRLAL